jgi:hypothetical protein
MQNIPPNMFEYIKSFYRSEKCVPDTINQEPLSEYITMCKNTKAIVEEDIRNKSLKNRYTIGGRNIDDIKINANRSLQKSEKCDIFRQQIERAIESTGLRCTIEKNIGSQFGSSNGICLVYVIPHIPYDIPDTNSKA